MTSSNFWLAVQKVNKKLEHYSNDLEGYWANNGGAKETFERVFRDLKKIIEVKKDKDGEEDFDELYEKWLIKFMVNTKQGKFINLWTEVEKEHNTINVPTDPQL